MSSSGEEDAYGPPLPTVLKSKHNRKSEDPATSSGDEDGYGPPMPPHLIQSFGQKRRLTNSDDGSKEDACIPSLPCNLMENEMREKGDGDGDSSDSESYRPVLPPHMYSKSINKKGEANIDRDEDENISVLPPSMQKYGQKRKGETEPDQNKLIKKDTEKEESEEDEDMYLPALPPHLLQRKYDDSSLPNARRILGPTLPAGFIPPESLPSVRNIEEEECSESDEDEDLVIGPTPSAVAFNEKEYRIQQVELRAKKMKDKLEGKYDESSVVKRETWMLELPEDKPNFCGLAARQFMRKAPQEKGDRSVWTDTPVDKERKAQMDNEEVKPKKDPERVMTQQRDDALTAGVDKYNQEKRAKPLIELHKKKLKEKEEKSGPKERRPFSREEDMSVNKFDEAQKSNILKKARQLNDRFSPGGKKFL